MKRVAIFFFVFFTMSLFAQMPTRLTDIHRLGTGFNDFQKNNTQYDKTDNFLVRTKPQNINDSWNYDLIVLEGTNDKISSMLFRRYNMSSKEHIKRVNTLSEYLSNQFKANLYSVTDANKKDTLLNYISSDAITKYISKSFDKKNIETQLLLTDDKTIFSFFKYNNEYYIYMATIIKTATTTTSSTTSTTTTIPQQTTTSSSTTTTTTIPQKGTTSTTTTTIPPKKSVIEIDIIDPTSDVIIKIITTDSTTDAKIIRKDTTADTTTKKDSSNDTSKTTTSQTQAYNYDYDMDMTDFLDSDIMRDEFDLLEKMQIIMNSYEKKDEELKKHLSENRDKFSSMEDFFIDLRGRVKDPDLKKALDYQIKIFENQKKINDLVTNTNNYDEILKLIDESNSLFKDFIDALKSYYEENGL